MPFRSPTLEHSAARRHLCSYTACFFATVKSHIWLSSPFLSTNLLLSHAPTSGSHSGLAVFQNIRPLYHLYHHISSFIMHLLACLITFLIIMSLSHHQDTLSSSSASVSHLSLYRTASQQYSHLTRTSFSFCLIFSRSRIQYCRNPLIFIILPLFFSLATLNLILDLLTSLSVLLIFVLSYTHFILPLSLT